MPNNDTSSPNSCHTCIKFLETFVDCLEPPRAWGRSGQTAIVLEGEIGALGTAKWSSRFCICIGRIGVQQLLT
jgi:hypothetical protein